MLLRVRPQSDSHEWESEGEHNVVDSIPDPDPSESRATEAQRPGHRRLLKGREERAPGWSFARTSALTDVGSTCEIIGQPGIISRALRRERVDEHQPVAYTD